MTFVTDFMRCQWITKRLPFKWGLNTFLARYLSSTAYCNIRLIHNRGASSPIANPFFIGEMVTLWSCQNVIVNGVMAAEIILMYKEVTY